jgi:regulator of protease activity HflC (stomatin/prohibitin superfamily)
MTEVLAEHGVYIVLGAAVFVLLTGIRIAKENERFIVTTLGRYSRIIGPGLLYKLPGPTAWHRVALGDEGIYLGDSLVQVNKAVFPGQNTESLSANTPVRISSFASEKITVSAI